MRNRTARHEMLLLLLLFAVSRWLVYRSGVRFQYENLFTYWQYLDVESLRQQLFRGVWYLHAQPPLFNVLAGSVLQLSGRSAPLAFHALWMGISLLNAGLLLQIAKRFSPGGWLPFAVAAWYLLSPATILFENELFYTSFTSLLLLLCLNFSDRFARLGHRSALAGFFLCATLLCLTRSLYHLLWLAAVSGILLYRYRQTLFFKNILLAAALSAGVAGAWYGKNLALFGTFSASSWSGINLARIVFHDVPVKDPAAIEAIHPFYPVSAYKRFLQAGYTLHYKGWNDDVLLKEWKNDSAVNMNHVAYLSIARQYGRAAQAFIRLHPLEYLRHAGTSVIIFFSPASSYFQVNTNCRRIAGYDLVCSGNLSHLFSAREQKKRSLALAAVPKFLCYLLVLGYLLGRESGRSLTPPQVFTCFTILFVFVTSSLLEYGENMRFRYELEPLFMLLAAQAFLKFRKSRAAARNNETNFFSE